MQLYIRAGFSLPAQASFFLVCAGDSVGVGYSLCIMPRPDAWKRTYIMVIGKFHSRMSCMWQYLINSQVFYGYTLNTDLLFDNRYWHAVDLSYKRNLLSCIWSILDTLKVMLSRTWQMSHTWQMSCTWQEFCRPMWWQFIDT